MDGTDLIVHLTKIFQYMNEIIDDMLDFADIFCLKSNPSDIDLCVCIHCRYINDEQTFNSLDKNLSLDY